MIALLWSTLAFAQQPCPPIAVQVTAARAQFDDAELEAAKGEIEVAYESLSCQPRVLETDELLALYRLDGLVSLALEDRKGATYATIRAVAADHLTGAPPLDFGPDLAEEYNLWAERLGASLIYVRVRGAGTVWVDGRTVDASSWIRVASGEHLVQVQTPSGLRSRVIDLAADHVVETGEPGPGPADLPAQSTGPGPQIGPDPAPTAGRRHPPALVAAGVGSAALGGLAIFLGSRQEAKFAATTYDADVYGDCSKGQPCYTEERASKIENDAYLANGFYGTGYALCAVGGGLLLTGAVGINQPTMLTVGGRF